MVGLSGRASTKALEVASTLRHCRVYRLLGARLVCSIVACCLLSACAQINRYPEYPQRHTSQFQWPDATRGTEAYGTGVTVQPNSHVWEIRAAIAHAEATYVSMQRHINSRDTLINSLAVAAFILAGGLAADAIIDQSKDFTTIGVIAGLTSYSIVEWLTDPANDNLYALGMTAIDCGIRAVGPLMGTEEVTGPLTELNTAIGDLTAQKQALLNLGALTTNTKLIRFLESRVEAADALIEAAETAEKLGRRLQVKIDKAGHDLTNLVRNTHLKVVKKLIDSAQDVSDLRSQVASMVFKPSDFIKFSDPSDFVFGGLEVPTPEALDSEVGRFSLDTSELEAYKSYLKLFDQDKFNESFGRAKAATNRVQEIVQSVDYSQAEDRLKQCGIDVPPSTPPLNSDLTKIVIQAGQAQPIELNISGGSGKYGVAFSPQVPGLSVVPKTALGPTFAVSATDKVKAGSYRLKIVDSDDKTLLLLVKVQDATRLGDSLQPSGVCSGSAVTMGIVQLRLQQFGFNPGPVDCVCGTKTENAIRSFWNANGSLIDSIGRTAPCTSLATIEYNLAIAHSQITDPAARTPLGIKTLALEDLLRQKLGATAARLNGVLDPEEQRLIVGCTFSPIPTEAELDTAIGVVRAPAFGRTKP